MRQIGEPHLLHVLHEPLHSQPREGAFSRQDILARQAAEEDRHERVAFHHGQRDDLLVRVEGRVLSKRLRFHEGRPGRLAVVLRAVLVFEAGGAPVHRALRLHHLAGQDHALCLRAALLRRGLELPLVDVVGAGRDLAAHHGRHLEAQRPVRLLLLDGCLLVAAAAPAIAAGRTALLAGQRFARLGGAEAGLVGQEGRGLELVQHLAAPHADLLVQGLGAGLAGAGGAGPPLDRADGRVLQGGRALAQRRAAALQHVLVARRRPLIPLALRRQPDGHARDGVVEHLGLGRSAAQVQRVGQRVALLH
mmetsp:Transcript_8385/g.15785  ORF Transcript_8385/g.15785 Transcript_8385/m.15785 type:complete len:306 (+) Transcript_8385:4689-5606(+)